MKKILVAAAIAALGVTGAQAADMAVKAPMYTKAAPVPVSTWTGCYVGVNVGGASEKSRFNSINTGLSEGSYSKTGVAGGGQVGCDYQISPMFVVGIQGMVDATGINGSGPNPLAPTSIFNTKATSFETLTARLGILVTPSVMLYGKGGAGWINNKFTYTTLAPLVYSSNNTASGYDAGAGIDWMFAPNWDVFLEYDHIGASRKSLTFVAPTAFFPENTKTSLDKVLVGVDYRFSLGGPVVAKY